MILLPAIPTAAPYIPKTSPTRQAHINHQLRHNMPLTYHPLNKVNSRHRLHMSPLHHLHKRHCRLKHNNRGTTPTLLPPSHPHTTYTPPQMVYPLQYR